MKHYSTDKEVFNHHTIEDAVQELFGNDPSINVGDVIEVFEGEENPVDEHKFIPNIAEQMRELIYDEFGELAGDYPDLTSDQESELQSEVEETVEAFLSKNDLLAPFYRVKNIKAVSVLITERRNEFECEWQTVY